MARLELTDEQWNVLADLLPAERGRWARPSRDNRIMVNAVLWIHRTGAPWRDLPAAFGPWKSAWTRFDRWARAGIWQRALSALAGQRDCEVYMIDSSIIRAHQHAAGAKKSMAARRSAVPAEGLPPKFMLSSMDTAFLSISR
jgi:transposase